MLEYPPRALPALVRIFSRINNIHVFVEDATVGNMYKVFLSRLLPQEVALRRVYKCQGRKGVIDASADPRYLRLKGAFFLVDGDLYLLCGEKQPLPDRVYRLDCYCIENMFLCLEAAVRIAFVSEPELSIRQLRARLRLDLWLNKTTGSLMPLFEWYAVALKLESGIKTVSINGIAFLNPKTAMVSKRKIGQKISSIRIALRQGFSESEIQNAIEFVRSQSSSASKKHSLISAKSYLIPLLARYLARRTKFRDESGFSMRLVHECNPDAASSLRQALLEVLSVTTS